MAKSAVIGAASAAVTFGIGSAAGSLFTNFYSQAAFSAAAHGTFQGGMTAISGGKFWSGFAAGALSSIAASAWSGGSSASETHSFGGASFMETFDHQGISGALGANNTVGMIAFGTVSGGVGAELTGGNFWQSAVTGLVVSGLNHASHMMDDGDIDPPTKKGNTTKQKTMPQKLHNMFDSIEEVGGWMEIGGLAAAPFTEGTSLGVTMIGGYFSAVGTAGNILVDGYQYLDTKNPTYLKSATFRGVKAIATAGMGKAIDRIPGEKYMTDKIILKAQVFVYEKLVSPAVRQRLILPTKNK